MRREVRAQSSTVRFATFPACPGQTERRTLRIIRPVSGTILVINPNSTVAVTAGYIHAEPRRELYAKMDAANVDLKAFTESFYGKITLTHLKPVLETLEWLKKETKVWFEITNLMIPTLNDDPSETRKLAEWILTHLGPDVPLHFTAFHPDFKLQDKPRTPAATDRKSVV